MWTTEQIVYFAAILDGEGHISIELQRANGKQKTKDYYTVRIVVANTCMPLMDWLVTNFQGRYNADKKYPGRKLCYRYCIFGSKLFNILTACYPYMIIKRQQAEIAFKFRETVGKTGWHVSEETLNTRKTLYLEMKKINAPGDHN